MTNNKRLTKEWIKGFTDAEGCFNVHITKNSTMELGEQVQLRFIVDQKVVDKQILTDIGRYFEHYNDPTVYKGDCSQIVICRQDLIFNRVVPFFRQNPLLTSKRLDFELWAECADLMKQKLHLTKEGLNKIKKINESLNVKTDDRKSSLPKGPITLTDDWVLGFLEGDGSFYMQVNDVESKSKSKLEDEEDFHFEDEESDSGYKTDKVKVQPRLEVGLHNHDRFILESLNMHFNQAGSFNDSTDYPHWYLRGINTSYNHVLPFFDAHPPLTVKKSREYKIFREAVILAKGKKHLTPEGAERIRVIKAELKRYKKGRKLKSNNLK